MGRAAHSPSSRSALALLRAVPGGGSVAAGEAEIIGWHPGGTPARSRHAADGDARERDRVRESSQSTCHNHKRIRTPSSTDVVAGKLI